MRKGATHAERFAPSPTGRLHLGHAYSALLAHDCARAADGRFLLRLEDLDAGRVRPAYADAILEDLRWLGVAWDGPVIAQSSRKDAYAEALAELADRGLTYRCRCTRRDIAEAASAPQEGATIGPDGPLYPGTCRGLALPSEEGTAVRLDMARAAALLGSVTCYESGAGPQGETGALSIGAEALVRGVGDVVLARRDGTPAYHLAVVVDDAWQQVTHVTRGEDLFSATSVHRVLQDLLGLPEPIYRHHRLIRDEAGRRLAKRDDARALASLRREGLTPADIRARVGL